MLPSFSAPSVPPIITLDQLQTLRGLYERSDFSALSSQLAETLRLLNLPRYEPLTEQDKALLSVALRLLLLVIEDPRFTFAHDDQPRVLNCSPGLGAALDLCGLPNTDALLQRLEETQPHKVIERLVLTSSHNSRWPDFAPMMRSHAAYVSLWWDRIFMLDGPPLSAEHHQRMCALLRQPAIYEQYVVHMQKDSANTALFFQVTYLDASAEAEIKPALNRSILRYIDGHLATQLPAIEPVSVADSNADTIVILSLFLRPEHAVYRSMIPLLEAWKPGRKLIGAWVANTQENANQASGEDPYLDEMHCFSSLAELVHTITQDWKPGLIFFLDVGMSMQSLILSNLRLAAVQATGYGHPASSYATEIDYFIGSAEADPFAESEGYYSEQFIGVPGLAAVPTVAPYSPRYPTLSREVINISLAWGRPKLNHEFLTLVLSLAKQTSRTLCFVLTDIRAESLYTLRLQKLLRQHLQPEQFQIYPGIPQSHYFPLLELCHFGIDSFPFGGFNRIVDSLHCGRPIVVMRGTRFYNRVAAQILEWMGLGELVADTPDELQAIATRLIESDDYRESLSATIREMDWQAIIRRHNPPEAYAAALNQLLPEN